MNRMEFFSVREILPDDTLHELRRARARNTLFDKEISDYKKTLEENDAMDEDYKMLMLGFVEMEERFVPEKEVLDKDDVNESDSEPRRKGKRAMKQKVVPSNQRHLTQSKVTNKVDKEENVQGRPLDMVSDSQKECDSELGKKVRRARKQKPGPSNRITDDKLFEPEPRRQVNVARKQKFGPSNQGTDVQKKQKHDQPASALKKTKSLTKKKVTFEVDKAKIVSDAPNDMVLTSNNECDAQPRRKVSRATKQNIEPSKQTLAVENQHPAQLGKQTDKVKDSSNDIVPDYHDLHLHQNNKLHDEIELNYEVNVDVKEERKDDSDSDVEILDTEAIIEKGTSTTFVPSKKVHKRMEELRGSGEFRKQVLNVLRKPFDKDEYNMHQEAVKCYLDHHPDLRGKLTKYRYKKGRRLTIYRGFFFWLQNLTQEGSFKPWMDRECLVVEPEYH